MLSDGEIHNLQEYIEKRPFGATDAQVKERIGKTNKTDPLTQNQWKKLLMVTVNSGQKDMFYYTARNIENLGDTTPYMLHTVYSRVREDMQDKRIDLLNILIPRAKDKQKALNETMMSAAWFGETKIVKYLVDCGADYVYKAENGKTLDICAQRVEKAFNDGAVKEYVEALHRAQKNSGDTLAASSKVCAYGLVTQSGLSNITDGSLLIDSFLNCVQLNDDPEHAMSARGVKKKASILLGIFVAGLVLSGVVLPPVFSQNTVPVLFAISFVPAIVAYVYIALKRGAELQIFTGALLLLVLCFGLSLGISAKAQPRLYLPMLAVMIVLGIVVVVLIGHNLRHKQWWLVAITIALTIAAYEVSGHMYHFYQPGWYWPGAVMIVIGFMLISDLDIIDRFVSAGNMDNSYEWAMVGSIFIEIAAGMVTLGQGLDDNANLELKNFVG
ncbi:hypothetical protein ACFQY8_05890 [Alloscardovia venturai]|uniref:Uncharacterized protein n=1 Tax=Alloscardovia venturai TaxID=1769421 RepID=A0ABW2YAY3_9BIFI